MLRAGWSAPPQSERAGQMRHALTSTSAVVPPVCALARSRRAGRSRKAAVPVGDIDPAYGLPGSDGDLHERVIVGARRRDRLLSAVVWLHAVHNEPRIHGRDVVPDDRVATKREDVVGAGRHAEDRVARPRTGRAGGGLNRWICTEAWCVD